MIAHDGKYKTIGYQNKTLDASNSLLDKVRAGEKAILQKFGMSDQSATVLTDPKAGPIEAAGALTGIDFSLWFERIALVIMALLFIGLGLSMLSGKSVTQLAGKLPV